MRTSTNSIFPQVQGWKQPYEADSHKFNNVDSQIAKSLKLAVGGAA